jgi:hypothetical protein
MIGPELLERYEAYERGYKRTTFSCSLVIADEHGNSVRTSEVVISRSLLPIYLARMLPLAAELGYALEVSR